MAKPTGRAIREELVVGARDLIQTLGIGQFSYGELAATVGIKSPSIHHYFPHREQLVAEVAATYRVEFNSRVAALRSTSPSKRIVAYASLYADTASSGRTCLCGAIASEWASAGELARTEIDLFFAEQRTWLVSQLQLAQVHGEIRKVGIDLPTVARMIFSSLQGSLTLAKSDQHFADTKRMVRELLKLLGP